MSVVAKVELTLNVSAFELKAKQHVIKNFTDGLQAWNAILTSRKTATERLRALSASKSLPTLSLNIISNGNQRAKSSITKEKRKLEVFLDLHSFLLHKILPFLG